MTTPDQPNNLPITPEPEQLTDLGLAVDESDLALNALAADDREPNEQGQQRTFMAAFRERRAEKRLFKAGVAAAERKYVVNVYGGERSNTLGFGSQAAKLARKSSVERAHLKGDLTAEERRRAHAHIATTPTAFENPEQRRTNNKQIRAHKKAGIPLPTSTESSKPAKTPEQLRRGMDRVNVPGNPRNEHHLAADEVKRRREALRDTDIELKEREQALRAQELEQRERVLRMRDEALARGETIDIPLPNERGRQSANQEDAAMQDYLKRKARWDEQTETIDKYKQQDEFADLFDEEKLRVLDTAIQADVAPLFDAALRTRIAELNKTLPDDEKWKPVDEMTVQEREEASKEVLTGKERGDIANPIDNKHTGRYLGDKAQNRDLVLAISWERRRLTKRAHEPRPPKSS